MCCSCWCVTVTRQSHHKSVTVLSVALFSLFIEVPREALAATMGLPCYWWSIGTDWWAGSTLLSAGCSDPWALPVVLRKGETSDKVSSFCRPSTGPLTWAFLPCCLIRIGFRTRYFCQHVFLTEDEIKCYNERMCNRKPTPTVLDTS